jgi:hypothetical protein
MNFQIHGTQVLCTVSSSVAFFGLYTCSAPYIAVARSAPAEFIAFIIAETLAFM